MSPQSDLAKRLTGPGGPYELARDQTDGLARFVRAPHTVTDLISTATRAADRPFLRRGERTLSLHQALDRAARLCTLLSTHVGGGQTVGLAVDDPLDWVVAFLALQGLGAATALLPPDLDDYTEVAGLVGCTALLWSNSHGSGANSLPCLKLDQARLFSVLEPLGRALDDAPPTMPVAKAASDIAIIALTSGTTSQPKAVQITHENLVTGLRTMQLGAALTALRRTTPAPRSSSGRTRALLLSPLFHIGGYGQVLGALTGGSELIFPITRTPAAIAAMVADERVSAVMGAPERLVWDLIRLHGRYDLSSIVTIGVFGVALEPEALAQVAAALPAVRPGTSYGLTETSGAIAVASNEDLQRKPGVSGALAPNVDIQIRGDDGSAVGLGQTGGIWLRGAMVTSGYIGCETPIQDGWFETGDQGWLDQEGFLFVIDRSAFSVFVAGHELTSGAIESLARASPGVAEAAAIRPHLGAACAVVLFVATLDDDAGLAVRRALGQAWPTAAPAIVVVEKASLPRTRSGKIDRQGLRASFTQPPGAAHALPAG